MREYIYKNSYVENIVSLPQGSFKPYTEVKTSILFLKNIKEKLNQDYVWYFTVKNDGFTLNTKRKKIVTGNNDLDIFLAYNNSYEENNLMHLGFNKLIMDELKKNDFISIPNQYIEFSYNTSTNIIECKNMVVRKKLRFYKKYK
ncbi:N-6 DNA methylase [Spiroplasma citri]|uniref:N-6 DNA methylase n=1 Tax=Spiroplasma citri TaxID=2133 RepID=UPI0011BBDE1C|nr:N-6 DNA methylase [Spiroplasma citri]